MNKQQYALLIGINDYSATDPSGGSDLKGALNDVRTWWRMARKLRIPVQNIRVLTHPRIEKKELGLMARRATLTGASGAEITEGFAWLAEKLREPGAGGLVYYGGHGANQDDELVLCPSDTAPDLSGALSYAALEAMLRERGPLSNLTVFLDTCFAGAGSGEGQASARSLSAGALPTGAGGKVLFGNEALVLASSAADEVSCEHPFNDGWHGAFTWALAHVLHRWELQVEGTERYVNVSYASLADRARQLLAALAFPQTPLYDGPAEEADSALFHRLDGDGNTTEAPAVLGDRELSGGETGYRTYDIECDSEIVGNVYVDTTNNSHTEDWFVLRDKTSHIDGSGFKLIVKEDTPEPPAMPSSNDPAFFSWTVNYANDNWHVVADSMLSGPVFEKNGSGTSKFIKIKWPTASQGGSVKWFNNNNSDKLLFSTSSSSGSAKTYVKKGDQILDLSWTKYVDNIDPQ